MKLESPTKLITWLQQDVIPSPHNLAEAGTKTVRSTLIMEIRQKKLSQKEHNQTVVVPSVNCSMPMFPSEAAVSQGGNSPF